MRKAEHEHNLRVCDTCLMAIVSHEGRQYTKPIYFDDDEGVCEWCEESGFDKLNELI